MLRTNINFLCGVKFWATKNNSFTVDNVCYGQYVVPLWENAKKIFVILDGNLASRSFFVRFTVPNLDFFKCCDPSCTSVGDDPINVNSLAFLDDKSHCFCSHCLDFSTVDSDTKCPSCDFHLTDSYNRLTLVLSAIY